MKTTSRTISQIVRAHTLTYFNLLNVILAGFIILSGQYKICFLWELSFPIL